MFVCVHALGGGWGRYYGIQLLRRAPRALARHFQIRFLSVNLPVSVLWRFPNQRPLSWAISKSPDFMFPAYINLGELLVPKRATQVLALAVDIIFILKSCNHYLVFFSV
jgi:hypothetical protein